MKTVSLSTHSFPFRWSQWPRRLRRRSTAACYLGLWVRILLGAWTSVCCECCVLPGGYLCDVPIPRSYESYWVWCVWVPSWSLAVKVLQSFSSWSPYCYWYVAAFKVGCAAEGLSQKKMCIVWHIKGSLRNKTNKNCRRCQNVTLTLGKKKRRRESVIK